MRENGRLEAIEEIRLPGSFGFRNRVIVDDRVGLEQLSYALE